MTLYCISPAWRCNILVVTSKSVAVAAPSDRRPSHRPAAASRPPALECNQTKPNHSMGDGPNTIKRYHTTVICMSGIDSPLSYCLLFKPGAALDKLITQHTSHSVQCPAREWQPSCAGALLRGTAAHLCRAPHSSAWNISPGGRNGYFIPLLIVIRMEFTAFIIFQITTFFQQP